MGSWSGDESKTPNPALQQPPLREWLDVFSGLGGAPELGRSAAEGRTMVEVAWVPGWYELDPSLEVGLTDEFAFWRVVPDYLRGPEPMVLYNTIWDSEDVVVAHGTITAIRHPELGAIRKVDTRGLDYTIILADGTELRVEAEETPGVCYEREVSDWRFIVTFNSLNDPKPAEQNVAGDREPQSS